MDREILGIDHGNRQMKTANTAFLSTVTQNKVKPSNLNQILEFKGKYYSIGGSREDVDTKVDKTVDDDYYILTLASLAAELKARGKNQAAVRLATGLPPRWYESQMKAFRKYLGRERELSFRYQGEGFNVFLEGVSVYMQGFAAITDILAETQGKSCLLVDIGGGTVDGVPIENMRPSGEQPIIDKNGTIKCISNVNEALMAEFGEKAKPYIIETIMRTGTYAGDEAYLRVIRKALNQYTEYIYSLIKKHGYNLHLEKIIFMGGGAAIMQNFGDNEGKDVICIPDIHANARGYEETLKSIWKARQNMAG